MVYDATIPWDMRFFESLDRIVQTEPWLTRDKVMIDQLKSIGIEKGKPFNPDAKTQDTLNASRRARPTRGWRASTRPTTSRRLIMTAAHWLLPVSPDVIARPVTTFFARS